MIGARLARTYRLVGCGLLLAASPVGAGWREMAEADARLDLATAREQALATVAADQHSPEAVAAAGWWLENAANLVEPEALLAVTTTAQDPELGYLLAQLTAELASEPPAGCLPDAELAGPFGAFDTLDLERGVVPVDADLPRLETGWQRFAPFRLRVKPLDGWIGPAEALAASGVYLAAWSFTVEEATRGWLVVEVAGSANLELDGAPIARLRDCGARSPTVNWFAVDLEAGAHRVRAELASVELPRARLSLFGPSGDPLPVGRLDTAPAHLAGSRGEKAQPPAAASLDARLATGGSTSDALLAAALARQRGDPPTARSWLERALRAEPSEPLPHLALARFFLEQPTGSDPQESYRSAQEHLRQCQAVPASLLVEHALAAAQDRADDRERLIGRLMKDFPDDPRVLTLWTTEALERGWPLEAQAALEKLREVLPASPAVAELRLKVLEASERWQERLELLQALATAQPTPEHVREMASACQGERALELLGLLRERADDVDLDLAMIRQLLEAGEPQRAQAALDLAEQRWGAVPVVNRLRLVAAAAGAGDLTATLANTLAAEPADLRLEDFSWRRGGRPFYAPFQVDALAVAAAAKSQSPTVDSVLLLDQAVERVYADGSSIYYYHGLSRAITPAGAGQAAALQRLEGSLVLRLRVIKPDGSVVVPEEQRGEEGLALLDVAPGDLVEEEYVAAVSPVAPTRRGHLSPYVYRFADPARAFGLSEYVLLVPDGVDLRLDGRFEGLEHEEWEEDGLHVQRWRAQDVPPVAVEPLGPPTQELLPWVTYGFGVSWEDVGDELRDRVLRVLPVSPELSEWARPLLAESDPVAAVSRLVGGLADAVDYGRGVLDLGSTAGESFSRRRGNRLGIVAGVLAADGWQVDLVLTRPLPFAGTHLKVPSMDSFQVPVLRAAHSGQTVWVDLGDQRRGVNHVDPILQRSDGLVLPLSDPRAKVTYLEHLPEFENPELEERVSLRADLDASGQGQLDFSILMRGAEGERALEQVGSVPPERVDLIYRQLAGTVFPGARDVSGSIDRAEDGVVLRLKMVLPDACDVMQGTMSCRRLVLAKPLSPVLASLPERSFPLVLQLPTVQRVELEVHAPPDWTMELSPRRLETGWGTVDEQVEVTSERLHSVLHLKVASQVIQPSDYPAFVRFCHAVDELVSRPLQLRRTDR